MTDKKEEKLTEMVCEFCDEYLNDEYKEMSQKIIGEMANGNHVYFKRGKLEVWASAVIYAVCQINSLFDESDDVHITRKDIFNYFNTNQAVVLKKAVNLRNIYNLDSKFSSDKTENYTNVEFDDDLLSNILDDIGDYDNMTVEDYQKLIDYFEEGLGKRFFEENEGEFWLILETRPYMEVLFNQAHLLWKNGEQEKAINQFKYMLKLNPNDNQGVRDVLLPHLLELNRIEEAEKLYLQYKDDFTSGWKFDKLLLDIKNNAPLNQIKSQYKKCIKSNQYIVPFLLDSKLIPNENPQFFSLGDRNEAIFYVMFAGDAWHSDEKAMRILRRLSEK